MRYQGTLERVTLMGIPPNPTQTKSLVIDGREYPASHERFVFVDQKTGQSIASTQTELIGLGFLSRRKISYNLERESDGVTRVRDEVYLQDHVTNWFPVAVVAGLGLWAWKRKR